jgi:hypothetical protein
MRKYGSWSMAQGIRHRILRPCRCVMKDDENEGAAWTACKVKAAQRWGEGQAQTWWCSFGGYKATSDVGETREVWQPMMTSLDTASNQSSRSDVQEKLLCRCWFHP